MTPSPNDAAARAKITFGLDELQALKSDAFHGRPCAARASTGLAIRLLTGLAGDAHAVLDEIDCLEGVRESRNTKPASQFCHAPLHPLWHKHYLATRHILPNIGIRWGVNAGGNRDFDRMIRDVARAHGENPDQWPGIVAHRFAHDGYVDRSHAGRLTGDWIIFAEHGGTKYYLDLAMHEEGLPENASRLLAKLQGSAGAEFPFVFECGSRTT